MLRLFHSGQGRLLCALLIVLLQYQFVNAQASRLLQQDEMFVRDSVLYIRQNTGCKNTSYEVFELQEATSVSQILSTTAAKRKMITVNGNVLYNLDYRSSVDTPYADRNVYQHMLQVYMDITVKDDYPMRFYFTTRFSNSSWFKNLYDLNLQYTASEFTNRLKQRLKEEWKQKLPGVDDLNKLENNISRLRKQLAVLQANRKDPGLLQKQIEAREKLLYYNDKAFLIEDAERKDFDQLLSLKKMTSADSLHFSRLYATVENRNDSVTKQHDKVNIENEVKDIQDSIHRMDEKMRLLLSTLDSLHALHDKYVHVIKQNETKLDVLLYKNTSASELRASLKSLDIPDTALPKGYKLLTSIRSLNIGRSLVDYSELSAKNVNISGVQVEYNPSYYLAFATGSVDYQFRDFVISSNAPKQYLTLVRGGLGDKDASNVILTYYTGKRQLYNASSAGQSSITPNYNLLGYTLEGNYKINATTVLTGEFAKSSLPYYRATGTNDLVKNSIDFNDRSNEAYSFKLNSLVNKTNTRITAYYKHYGANFQSFSLFTTGSAQSAWLAKIDQSFWRNRIAISSSIKKNEYNNPYVEQAFSSAAIFKSITATFRMRNWPVISIGYYPSSQLTKLSDAHFSENQFYTMVGTVNHYYRLGSLQTNTTVIYTRFYNKPTDSNFVYFNTKNIQWNQAIYMRELTIQGNASLATNTEYNLYGINGDAEYKVKSWFTLGGGIKYIHQTVFDKTNMGYTCMMRLNIHRVGDLECAIDKYFLPGSNKQLVESYNGRFTFLKTF